jgi:cytochrome c-type biogenesis protein CcmH
MTGWGFWTGAIGLAAAVVAVLITAMRRAPGEEGARSADPDLLIYKDQIAEVARDLARGTISAEEAERLRAEVGRRVLEADRARGAAGAGVGRGIAGPGRLAALVVLVATVPGAAWVYWQLGAPGYPDLPLETRLADLDAAIAARPGQEAELARLGTPRDAVRDAEVQAALASVTDLKVLRADFARHFQAGDMLTAIRTQERLLALTGAATESFDHANLALALVAEARGYVSPEAEAQLREALRRDLSNELARYLVGEMFLQGGRFDQAFRFWRPLVESGSPDAPWTASIRERIQMVADLAGIPYAAPEGGPSADDMAAAAEMSPEDRQAMIEGMVAQLSERLATEGGDVEDWERLIRSLAVLERLPDAQSIYDEAKVRFEGRPAELSFLRQAAVESGLSP